MSEIDRERVRKLSAMALWKPCDTLGYTHAACRTPEKSHVIWGLMGNGASMGGRLSSSVTVERSTGHLRRKVRPELLEDRNAGGREEFEDLLKEAKGLRVVKSTDAPAGQRGGVRTHNVLAVAEPFEHDDDVHFALQVHALVLRGRT